MDYINEIHLGLYICLDVAIKKSLSHCFYNPLFLLGKALTFSSHSTILLRIWTASFLLRQKKSSSVSVYLFRKPKK